MANAARRMLLSIATYAFNEEENLPILYDHMVRILGELNVDWELVVVDDHSSDGTFQVVRGIAHRDPRVRGFRLSRNFGSHLAKTCALHRARGDCAVVIAADLQEPPELIPELVARWKEGAHVVSALRRERPGEALTTIWFSRLYYATMRRAMGFGEMPGTDNSYCLLDRRVLDCLRQFGEGIASVAALVNWMGFRHVHVSYDQRPRFHGKSGWTLGKKVRLFIGTATMFSSRPVGWIFGTGGVLVAAGIAGAVLAAGWLGSASASEGWHSILAAILIIGGLQMLALGVLGEYLWQTLCEARRRPQYLIEETTEAH